MAHLRAERVVNPFEKQAEAPRQKTAASEVQALESLWSTPQMAAADAPAGPDLESIWMSELSSEAPSSLSSIEFTSMDETMDITVPQRTGGFSARPFRVDRPVPPRPVPNYEFVRDAEVVSTRQQARETARVPRPIEIQRPMQREAATVEAPPARPAPIERAVEYTSRPTVYQKLMSDPFDD